jgi:hypothetical protein
MTGDANADTAATGFDFLAWQRQFDGGADLEAAITIPEPSSLLLTVFGLFTLSAQRKGV